MDIHLNSGYQVRKGDIAFLLFVEVKKPPLYDILHQRFDAFETGLAYPIGLIEYIGNNRDTIHARVSNYLVSKKGIDSIQ